MGAFPPSLRRAPLPVRRRNAKLSALPPAPRSRVPSCPSSPAPRLRPSVLHRVPITVSTPLVKWSSKPSCTSRLKRSQASEWPGAIRAVLFVSMMKMTKRSLGRFALGRLLRCIGQRHLHIHAALPAKDGNVDGVASVMLIQGVREIPLTRNFLSVDSNDKVAAEHEGPEPKISMLGAAVQTGVLRCAIRKDALDQHTIICGQADLLGQIGADFERHDIHR